MQNSILAQFLLLMEDPVVVFTAAAVVLLIRLLWVRTHPQAAQAANAAPGGKPAGPRRDATLEVIDTVLIALILVFGIVRPFLLQTFFIPSPSMEPTLLGPFDPAHREAYQSNIVYGKKRSGDKLIANRFVLRFRAPRRGEIIVFKPPVEAITGNNPALQLRDWLENNPKPGLTAEEMRLLTYAALPEWAQTYQMALQQEQQPAGIRQMLLENLPSPPKRPDDFIKRVIAVPGDRVRIVPGEGVYVNGELLPETYLPKDMPRDEGLFPKAPVRPGPMPRLTQTPGDAVTNEDRAEFIRSFFGWLRDWYSYNRLYVHRIARHVTAGDYIVPDNSVFMMGDNRSETGSFDSRYWGAVPLENVRARAVSTFWPLNRLKLL